MLEAAATYFQKAIAMIEKGIEPPIWLSANVPCGAQRLAELAARYGGRRLRTI